MEQGKPYEGFPPFNREHLAERRDRRRVSFWIALVLGVFLFFSIMLNFFLFLGLIGLAIGGEGKKGIREVVIKGEGPEKILRIPIKGIILEEGPESLLGFGMGMVMRVRKTLEAAQKDRSVKGILLEIDSPGGGVTASDTIYSMLEKFRKEQNIPVYSCMKDLGTSGGYYVAMASERIFVHPTTITGSIGVIMRFINYAGLLDKIGLEDVKIVSESTPFKDMGSASRQMRPEEKKLLLEIIEEMYGRFLDVVNQGRKSLDLEEVRRLADGRIFTGFQALKAGLIDEIGYEEDALESLRKKVGAPQARVIEYRYPSPSLLDLLFGEMRGGFGKSLLDSELEAIVRRRGPMALYLWTGY